MKLLKYGEGWTRRHFLEQTAKGIMAAGVLAPLWQVIGNTGTCEAAYPPELLSIEAYTKGKLKIGGVLNADNVDIVKDILNPGLYHQIKNERRVCDLAPSETRLDHLMPKAYLEATLHNKGKYKFGSDGNLWTMDGQPWQGGNPFPEPTDAKQVLIANTLSFSKYDSIAYGVRDQETDAAGNIQYRYDFYAVEWQTVGRTVLDPKPYQPGHKNQLRYYPDFVTFPEDLVGTSFLQIWSYDQRRFPLFYGYTPMLKRTRTFPTDQRFEPGVPGDITFTSDLYMVGDPLLTWGDFKLVGKGPLLATPAHGRMGINKDWSFPLVGGQNGQKYYRTPLELIPETYCIELRPTHFPRAPYGKKRVWYDARSQVPVSMLTYDLKGDPWHYKELDYGQWEPKPGIEWPDTLPKDKDGFWYLACDQNEDLQSGRQSHFYWVPATVGGHKPRVNDPALFEEYCSMDALRRMGR